MPPDMGLGLNEAIEILDNYFGDLKLNKREEAWGVVKEKLNKLLSDPLECSCPKNKE